MRTVLVALTGYGRDEDRRQAIAAGFDYHVVKPVSPDALHGVVTRSATSVAPPEPLVPDAPGKATVH